MSDFARTLIAWHAEHGRHDLPWQQTRDPYRIWLSEIMLQQTQVDTVIPYYTRFLARFPDLPSLAAAEVDDVLGLWSGLGYYARARNLHAAARAVVERHGGRFPERAVEIAALPGIGRSTAAAVAAFAFGEHVAILDGNVKRVLCRVFGVGGFPGEKAVENTLWALAESLLPKACGAGTDDGGKARMNEAAPDDRPTDIAIYTQAQMDFGATLCTRARPACTRCPLAKVCVAFRHGRVAELPAARPRKARPHRESRVAVVLQRGQVLLEKRPPAGIWGGLLALPELPDEAVGHADAAAWVRRVITREAASVRTLAPVAHAFTHFTLSLSPVLIELAEPEGGAALASEPGPLQWLALDDLESAALPTPVRKILTALTRPGLF